MKKTAIFDATKIEIMPRMDRRDVYLIDSVIAVYLKQFTCATSGNKFFDISQIKIAAILCSICLRFYTISNIVFNNWSS